jgi:hypothetical protein
VQQFQYPTVTAHYVPYAELPDGQAAFTVARDDCGWEAFLPIIDPGMPADQIRELEQEVGGMLTRTFIAGYEACAHRLAEQMIAEGAVTAPTAGPTV